MCKETRETWCGVVRSSGDPGVIETSPRDTGAGGAPISRPQAGPRQRGFSLIEVLVATGIASAVLISISGLFIMGSQNVVSGANLSTATTFNQSILEEIRGFNAEKIYGLLNGQPGDSIQTWNTDQSNPTWTEKNAEYATEFAAVLDEWRTNVRESMPRGVFSLTVEGFDNRPEGADDGTATFGGAQFIRIQVTVHWTEVRGHGRQVTMNLLKF